MHRKINILLIAALLVCSCAPFTMVTNKLSQAAGDAKTRVAETSQTNTPAPTLTPTITPTPAPLSEPVPMMDGSTFESWELTNLVDEQKPELLIEKDGSFALDPDWPVARVDFVYKWWGNGVPIMNYQYLNSASGKFTSSKGQTVTAEALGELLAAISNLQSEPGMLYSLTHANDFPAWYLEFKGEDGEMILVQSTSNSFANGTPWNVYYNGKYYAKFDGSLLPAIQKIFPHEPYEYEYSFSAPNPYTIVYNVARDDNLGIPSFTGLLPIREDFYYVARTGDSGIIIFIRSDGLSGFIPDEVQSVIKSVVKVELTSPDKNKIRCNISDNHYAYLGVGWTISCPVEQPEGDVTFGFPIEIQFRTLDGKTVTTKGILSTYWGFSDVVTPAVLPEWMADAFARDPRASQLWNDHMVYDLEYMAVMNKKQAGKGTIYGEAVLLGETQWDGEVLRYTVASPFKFVDGKLTRWDLAREDIDTLLAALQTQPLANAALGASDDAILNLYVAKWDLTPDLESLWNFDPVDFNVKRQGRCSYPKVELPSKDQAFLGFAFNGGWHQSDSYQQQFAIVDGGTVPLNYIYYPTDDDPVALAIKPVSLNDRRFQSADVVALTTDTDSGIGIVILLGSNAATKSKDDLREVIKEYFGISIIDMSGDGYWMVDDVGLMIYPDGTTDFARCTPTE
jgi:hypothetical protein